MKKRSTERRTGQHYATGSVLSKDRRETERREKGTELIYCIACGTVYIARAKLPYQTYIKGLQPVDLHKGLQCTSCRVKSEDYATVRSEGE